MKKMLMFSIASVSLLANQVFAFDESYGYAGKTLKSGEKFEEAKNNFNKLFPTSTDFFYSIFNVNSVKFNEFKNNISNNTETSNALNRLYNLISSKLIILKNGSLKDISEVKLLMKQIPEITEMTNNEKIHFSTGQEFPPINPNDTTDPLLKSLAELAVAGFQLAIDVLDLAIKEMNLTKANLKS